MADTKSEVVVVTTVEPEAQESLPMEMRGTIGDEKDMYRMGKEPKMRRNFRSFTIISLSMTLMATWEVALGTSFYALLNGGTAGFIWLHLVAWIGMLLINISMAEMGSMAPTSGGQYHWVSEFAPRQCQKFLSFLIGWFAVLAWQTGAANTAYLAGLQIQGLLIFNYPSYVPHAYHAVLLCIAVITYSLCVSVFLPRQLPRLEGVVLVVHVAGFVAVVVTLFTCGPKGSPAEVFTTFNNYGGWSTDGASSLIGIMAVILPLLGADSAVHMSEELRDASKWVPRAMVWSTIANGAMGFVVIIAFCMVLGNIDDALGSTTGQPFVEVFFRATGSVAGTNALSAIVVFIQICCNLSIVATASRQLFAFARDGGVPFSKAFAYVPRGWGIPINSIVLTWVFTTLLCLICLRSAVAFNNIASMSIAGVMASYVTSIGCMTWRRMTNEPLLPSRYTLGKATGLAVNVAGLGFSTFFFVLAMFPPFNHPTVQQMNYAVVAFVAVLVLALAHFALQGRHTYVGPVEYVRKGV